MVDTLKHSSDVKISDKVKVTVNLTEDDVSALKELAGKKGTTVTSVLRQAIALQKFVDDAEERGGKVLVEDHDKSLRQIVFR